jgi:hypothetical protein
MRAMSPSESVVCFGAHVTSKRPWPNLPSSSALQSTPCVNSAAAALSAYGIPDSSPDSDTPVTDRRRRVMIRGPRFYLIRPPEGQ